MSTAPKSLTTQPTVKTTTDPAILKVLPDGTVLYKTYQQAEQAARQTKDTRQGGDARKKQSQVKLGETYLAKDGQILPNSLGSLVEFQLTGLIVVMVVLISLSLICAAIGRLLRSLQGTSAVPTVPAPVQPIVQTVATSGIHPGLTDQELVLLLTAAAWEALGSPVRIEKFRPLTARDLNWSAQGRSVLQSHRLK